MKTELAQRIAVVTGASSGIGLAVSNALLESGYFVYACSRSIGEDENPHIRRKSVSLDVRLDDSVASLVETIRKNHGRIDALVNCAGIGVIAPIEASRSEDIRDVFETNLFGVIRLCRAVIPLMRTQGSGHIVNMGSIAGRMGLPYQGLYSASKYALEGLTESLRIEVEDMGIRVSLILPGDYKTGLNGKKRIHWGEPGVVSDSHAAHVLKSIQKDADSGGDPSKIGALVARILFRNAEGGSHILGPAFQVFNCILKPFIPDRIFRVLMKRHFGIG